MMGFRNDILSVCLASNYFGQPETMQTSGTVLDYLRGLPTMLCIAGTFRPLRLAALAMMGFRAMPHHHPRHWETREAQRSNPELPVKAKLSRNEQHEGAPTVLDCFAAMRLAMTVG